MTLQVKRPFGKTISLSLLFLFILLFGSEYLARSQFIQSRLSAPYLGSTHRQFEIQFARLNSVVEREGSIDCIFLGNSLVWLDVNPQLFSEAYKTETGQDIHCFNFGVAAMPTTSASVLAKILVEDYQPKLLIYGIHAGDLTVPQEHEDARAILDTPWIKYRTNHFTVQGWLFTHLYAYRYAKQFQSLLRMDFSVLEDDLGSMNYQLYGFDPKTSGGIDVSELPDLDDPANQRGVEKYYDYRIQEENLDGLRQIGAQRGADMQVIVVTMPVHPNFYHFFNNGEKDYMSFIEQTKSELDHMNVPFWGVAEMPQIPDDYWWDYSHLNIGGAKIFSEWLGRQIGMAVNQGEIMSPTSNLMTIPDDK